MSLQTALSAQSAPYYYFGGAARATSTQPTAPTTSPSPGIPIGGKIWPAVGVPAVLALIAGVPHVLISSSRMTNSSNEQVAVLSQIGGAAGPLDIRYEAGLPSPKGIAHKVGGAIGSLVELRDARPLAQLP